MIIAGFKKKENDKSFYYIRVFSMNKCFKLYNYELNTIMNYFHKEKAKKISEGISYHSNDCEFLNKKVGENKGFILKFTCPINFVEYIGNITNKEKLFNIYLKYEINAYIINEIKIMINTDSLNKSFNFNLLNFIDNKDRENDALINKRIKTSNSVHNNENNNNFNIKRIFFIRLINFLFSYMITSGFVLNEFKNIGDSHIKLNKKKFSNLEVSKNKLNFSFKSKKIKSYKIEKSEFAIYGKNYLIGIKPKGIINRYGCCYLNAAIQCFYHCPRITSFFLLNRELILEKGGPISLGYLEVIEEFSKNKNNYISINNFRKILIENDESFIGNDGNDSKDVILLLLYSLQNELGGEETDINLDIDNTKEQLLFQDLLKSNRSINSIIMENFGFIEKKINKCFVCGGEYFNLSNQFFITFNLKNIYEHYQKEADKEKNKVINKAISIEECLTFNCFEEANLQIKCQKCNKIQDSLTTISFATVPHYLFFILDRGINEEFECNFDFKEQIDLNDLYYPVKGEKRESNLKYTLIAGTILHGNHGSGHTFSFAKHFDGNLYIFNDTQFKKTTFNEIRTEKVYLLFYQRLSNFEEKKINKF